MLEMPKLLTLQPILAKKLWRNLAKIRSNLKKSTRNIKNSILMIDPIVKSRKCSDCFARDADIGLI